MASIKTQKIYFKVKKINAPFFILFNVIRSSGPIAEYPCIIIIIFFVEGRFLLVGYTSFSNLSNFNFFYIRQSKPKPSSSPLFSSIEIPFDFSFHSGFHFLNSIKIIMFFGNS